MAQQDIKVTVVGDTLPVGGAKINANFAEVRAELVIAEAAATTAANVAAQASADAAAATSAVATATSDAAAAVAAVAAATAASDAAVAAVAAATANNAVTDAKLRDSAAVSVIGRSANSSGDPADIAAGSNDQVLARVSNALAFQQLTVGMVPNDLITYAKLQNVANTSRILGRITSGAGDAEELTGTQATTLLDAFTSSLKGLAPASGGGSSAYLRADGLWSAPTTAPAFAATSAETTAAVTVTDISKISSPWLDLRRYGVDFTDSAAAATNNTAVLNAIGAAAWPSYTTLYWPPGVCRINDTVTFSDIHLAHYFENHSEIDYYGTANKNVLIFGNASVSTSAKTLFGGHGITVVNQTSHAWTDETFIGVKILGSAQNIVATFAKVDGFTINLQLRPGTSGIAYSKFYLGVFQGAKYNIDIHSFATNEFVNENQFFGGSFRAGSLGSGDDSYGVRFTAESGAYRNLARNVFYKPSFELGNASGATNRTAVLYTNAGVLNEFYGCRVETGRQYIVDIASDLFAVSRNYFEAGNNSGVFTANQRETDGGLAFGNTFADLVSGRPHQSPAYHSGDLVRKAFGTDTAKVSIKGCFLQNSGTSTEAYTGTAKILKDYIYIADTGDALGVYIDTSYYKSFVIQKDALAGFTGRTACVCYDSTGAVLTSAGGGHPYAVGWNGTAPWSVGSASYGYRYITASADDINPVYLTVGSAVDKIKLLFLGSTTLPLHLRGFSVYAVAHESATRPLRIYTGLAQTEDQWYCNGAPGTVLGGHFYATGQRIANAAVAVGGINHYVATTGGWNASAWVAATVYVIGQLVNNDTGKTYQCLTAGTSAGSGGPTGTATSGITDNTAVWGYIGTQAVWAADIAGQSSITQGDLLYGSAANTIAKLAKDANATRYLANTGTTNNPAWAQVALATGVSGTLPETSGGTGQSTITQGDLLYGSAANTISALAKNASATRSLTNTGASNSPAWAQVALATGVSGTLPETNGGTGQSTLTQGDILYASAANTVSKLAKSSTTTHALLNTGASNSPAWGLLPLASGISGVLPQDNGGATFGRVASDQTAIGTSFADITGLTFSMLANATYEISAYLNIDVDASTTGIDIALNGPASPTSVQYMYFVYNGTTTQITKIATAYDTDSIISNSAGAGPRTSFIIGVIQNGANAGTLAVRTKRENVGTGPNVRTGSWAVVRRIA